MNENGSVTNFTDSSGNGNEGVATNFDGDEYTDGKLNKAVDFDGNNDAVTILDNPVYDTTEITVSVWINTKVMTANKYGSIIDKQGSPVQDEWGLILDDTASPKQARFYVFDSSWDSANSITEIPDNSGWYHIVGTKNSTDISIYINGVLEDTTPQGTMQNGDAVITIGKEGNKNDRFFNGTIDEVAIWNRSLSTEKILNLYKRGATRLNISVTNTTTTYSSGFSDTFIDLNNMTGELNYTAYFETDNTAYTPELWNVTIGYESAGSADNTTPQVTILNDSFISDNTNTDIWFNVTDEVDATLSCSLLVDGVVNATNGSVINASTTFLTFTGATDATNYTINISCSDGTNTNSTESIWVYVDYNNAPPPPLIISPANATEQGDSPVTLTCLLNMSDADGDDLYLVYYAGNTTEDMGMVAGCGANSNCTYDLTIVDGEVWYWTCGTYDGELSANATEIRTFTADFDTALSSDESSCLLYGTFVNGTLCAVGKALKEEDTMIMNVIFVLLTTMAVFIGVGWVQKGPALKMLSYGIALASLIMAAFVVYADYIGGDVTEILRVNYYMLFIYGFGIAMVSLTLLFMKLINPQNEIEDELHWWDWYGEKKWDGKRR